MFLFSASSLEKLLELSCGRVDRHKCAHGEIKLHKNIARSGAGILRNVLVPILMRERVFSSRAC